jgi:hypothetical protein
MRDGSTSVFGGNSMPTYLVSGAPDIAPSHKNLRRRGKVVRYDTEINGNACVAMRHGRRYIVIAHGTQEGVVQLFRTDWNESRRWLYAGMPHPPKGASIYLYACHSGTALPRALRHCVVAGHFEVVPTPVDEARDVVLAFLSKVEALVASGATAAECRLALEKYVDKQLADAADNANIIRFPILHMLRKSLDYPARSSGRSGTRSRWST